MPRPRNLNPCAHLNISIDRELKARLERVLFDQSLGYVPKGAWQGFIEERIREWFNKQERMQREAHARGS